MEPYRLEAAFLNAINDACVANGIVMPGPSYGVTVSPTPTPVAFNAQVSGTSSPVLLISGHLLLQILFPRQILRRVRKPSDKFRRHKLQPS